MKKKTNERKKILPTCTYFSLSYFLFKKKRYESLKDVTTNKTQMKNS